MSLDTTLDVRPYKYRRGYADHYSDPEVELRYFATAKFLADTVGTGRVRYLSHSKFNLPAVAADRYSYGGSADEAYPIPTTGLLIQTVHACFATHQGFGLNPDVIWQVIVNQVAEHIKLDPDRYADLFTWFPGERVEIEVRDDELAFDSNWLRTLGKFEDPLRFAIGDKLVSLLVPDFSTTTQLDRVAALVTLMDAASPYYEYSVMTMCHIPLIRLEGSPEDWRQLSQRTATLAKYFVGLQAYFTELLEVLAEISRTAAGGAPDNEFWSSAYKFNSSSGGEDVTGWLTALLAYKYGSNGPELRESFDWRGQMERPWTAFRTNEIPSLLSTVPFTWKNQGSSIPMTFVAGALGVHQAGEVFTPRLGVAVMER